MNVRLTVHVRYPHETIQELTQLVADFSEVLIERGYDNAPITADKPMESLVIVKENKEIIDDNELFWAEQMEDALLTVVPTSESLKKAEDFEELEVEENVGK